MLMTVSKLDEHVTPSKAKHYQMMLGDIAIEKDGTEVILQLVDIDEEKDEYVDRRVELDDVALRALCRFLGLPFTYLEGCPGGMKAINLNYWIQRKANETKTESAVVIVGENGLEELRSPDKVIIPVTDVVETITANFVGTDEVAELFRDDKIFQIDVVSHEETLKVEPNGIGDRKAEDLPEDGDVTFGGVRIHIPLDFKTPPTVSAYLNRLNDNGIVIESNADRIRLKGRTADDVVEAIGARIGDLLAEMGDTLKDYKRTTELLVPGNPIEFIRTVCKEHGISQTLTDRAMDFAAGEGDVEWTLYDVIQIFSRLARNATFTSGRKLQALAGQMVEHSDEMLARCSSCERPIGHIHV